MTAIDDFIAALPKVELHVHLVGSASVPTVLELARRHTGHQVPTTEEGLRAFYEFRDFPHFAEVYFAVNSLVRDPEDVATLVVGMAHDLAAQNVRYVELTVTPFSHVMAGMTMPAVTEALDLAARQVADRIEVAYVFDIPGEFGAEAARATGRRGRDEPGDRGPAVRQHQDGRGGAHPLLPQARRPLPRRPGPPHRLGPPVRPPPPRRPHGLNRRRPG
jgi:hypothetical protein